MKNNKVAIYIRVSTKKNENNSLKSQKEYLEKFCESNGYAIYNVYTDEGKLNRRSYIKMMKDMRQGKFDKIIVTNLDRISKSTIDIEVFVQELKKNNCSFETISSTNDAIAFNLLEVQNNDLTKLINGIDD